MSNHSKDQDLNSLVHEVNNAIQRKNGKLSSRSFHLPPLTPIILSVTLVVLVAFNIDRYFSPHAEPTLSALASGEKFALKAIAEDIEAYRMFYGQLPDELPNSSAISALVNVKYEKVDNRQFKIHMQTENGEYTLDQNGTVQTISKDGT